MQRIFNASLAFLRARRSAPSTRISLAQAFSAEGVTLRDPQLSWSGIRDADGAVVIAIRRTDIQRTPHGFRCLLWSPLDERERGCSAEPRMEERLIHCRLALLIGAADGLEVCGSPHYVQSGSLLAMQVEKWDQQYWATWRSAAPVAARRVMPQWQSEPAPMLAAA